MGVDDSPVGVQPRLLLGISSGTSADGIDLALIRVEGRGLERKIQVIAGGMLSLPQEVQDAVARALHWKLHELAAWHARLGQVFADAAAEFLTEQGVAPSELSAIGSHGQTVFHHDGDPECGSLQIGEPAQLAARLGVPVIADFRTADRALGGQGAPISPFADWVQHQAVEKRLAILNLGGIANLTLLEGSAPPRAWDCGPANGPLDCLYRATGASGFDQDGAMAESGQVLPDLLRHLQDDPFFRRSLPKSTGLERFGAALAERVRATAPKAALADQLRTCCALAAWAVADTLATTLGASPAELEIPLYLCGGGTHNLALVGELKRALPGCRLKSYRALGGDPDLREAVAFALLADAFLCHEAASWPSTTGCRRPARLGTYTPPPAGPINLGQSAI